MTPILESARQALAAYEPDDPQELVYRTRMLELLASAGAFQSTHFLPGHFTASAFVLSPERDALLLILHKKLGLWLQPGGHIEPSDVTLAAAARREVAEEVGAELEPALQDPLFDIDIHTIPPFRDKPAHEHFDVRFCFQARSRLFSASDEVVRAQWVPLSRLVEVTSDRSVLRAATKLRR
ncbi:MAG: NUDIX domain-containing protein [Polyangiaceae bacterium]